MSRVANNGIGPDLDIPAGQIGEILIDAIVRNEAGNGYTATVRGGGVLTLRLSPEGQKKERLTRVAATEWTPEIRAKIAAVLTDWQNDPSRLGRNYWAQKHGVSPGLITRACDLRGDRKEPPMRAEYERASRLRNAAHQVAQRKARAA